MTTDERAAIIDEASRAGAALALTALRDSHEWDGMNGDYAEFAWVERALARLRATPAAPSSEPERGMITTDWVRDGLPASEPVPAAPPPTHPYPVSGCGVAPAPPSNVPVSPPASEPAPQAVAVAWYTGLPAWLLFYEDSGVRPEVFTTEEAVRARHAAASLGYECYIFKMVDAAHPPGASEPVALPRFTQRVFNGDIESWVHPLGEWCRVTDASVAIAAAREPVACKAFCVAADVGDYVRTAAEPTQWAEDVRCARCGARRDAHGKEGAK